MDIQTLAKAAYEAYGITLAAGQFRGRRLMPWDNLHTTVQAAWMSAASALLDTLDDPPMGE